MLKLKHLKNEWLHNMKKEQLRIEEGIETKNMSSH